MAKMTLVAAACRALAGVGVAFAAASSVAVPAVYARDAIDDLAAQIEAVVTQAQAEAAAAGLSESDTALLIQQRVQAAIVASGASPATVQAALGQAQGALVQAGVLSAAASVALQTVASNQSGDTGSNGGGAGGGTGSGSTATGSGSGSGGGGGGTDYRPGT